MARRDAIRRLLALALGLTALLALTLVLVPRDPDRIREAVDDAGAWAPMAYVAATAVLTVAFFPYPVVAGAGGLLFGVAAGAPLALLGEVLGATASFLLARGAGRRQAERLAGPRLRHGLEAIARRGFAAVLLVRVLPGVPRHPANYAFGLTGVSLGAFLAGTALGTAPRTLAYSALGGSLGDLRSPASIAAVSLLVAFGVLGLVLAARDPELRELTRRGGRQPATDGDDDGGGRPRRPR